MISCRCRRRAGRVFGDLVGPMCESGDFLARTGTLPAVGGGRPAGGGAAPGRTASPWLELQQPAAAGRDHGGRRDGPGGAEGDEELLSGEAEPAARRSRAAPGADGRGGGRDARSARIQRS